MLYEAFEARVLSQCPGTTIKTAKTQITFKNRCGFAFVSFLPVRRAAQRPKVYLTITFGLGRPVQSERIDACSEPYPGRFTHHVMVSSEAEIDGEMMEWITEAAAFAESKRR